MITSIICDFALFFLIGGGSIRTCGGFDVVYILPPEVTVIIDNFPPFIVEDARALKVAPSPTGDSKIIDGWVV